MIVASKHLVIVLSLLTHIRLRNKVQAVEMLQVRVWPLESKIVYLNHSLYLQLMIVSDLVTLLTYTKQSFEIQKSDEK